jgi:hypothetical protein
VGAADALASAPLSELMPQFLPGSSQLAAGLEGSSPAFSIAKARELLGWEPRRSWRTELAQPLGAQPLDALPLSEQPTIAPPLNDENPAALIAAGTGSK